MATEVLQQARLDRLSVEDFETASIRSAAPSYISDAPSYHSTLLPTESVPAYTPPAQNRRTNTSLSTSATNSRSMLPSGSYNRGPGLPPIPDAPRRSQAPQISDFRIGTWSSLNRNPNARQYQNVAHRRVSAANNGSAQVEGALRAVLGRLNEQEEERNRLRPLEDPYLVGEEAATRARRERLARENGDEILISEDRRWDWFLAQMKDWDERSQAWKEFESTRRRRFGH